MREKTGRNSILWKETGMYSHFYNMYSQIWPMLGRKQKSLLRDWKPPESKAVICSCANCSLYNSLWAYRGSSLRGNWFMNCRTIVMHWELKGRWEWEAKFQKLYNVRNACRCNQNFLWFPEAQGIALSRTAPSFCSAEQFSLQRGQSTFVHVSIISVVTLARLSHC